MAKGKVKKPTKIKQPRTPPRHDFNGDGKDDWQDTVAEAIDKFHKVAQWATQGKDKFMADAKGNAKKKWRTATQPFREAAAGIKQDFANAKLRGQKTPLTQYPPSLGGGSGGSKGGKVGRILKKSNTPTQAKRPSAPKSTANQAVVKNFKKIR